MRRRFGFHPMNRPYRWHRHPRFLGQPMFGRRRTPMILRFLFPLPIFVVIGLIVLLFSGVGIHMAGMMFMMLPMIAVPVVIGWVVLRLLNSDDLLPGNEKRKNEGTKYDYFEPESGDDPAILRTTDGRRYIRTETGEYKEIAE